jgi:citrate lyase beta subunit
MFFPAVSPERWDEAISTGADIIVFDMEDAVQPARKEEARRLALPLFERSAGRPLICGLRINSPRSDEGIKDLLAILETASPPDALVIPKVSSAEEIQWVAGILAPRHPEVEIVALVETEEGIERVDAIAKAAPQVGCVLFGYVDYTGEIGSDMGMEALQYARSRIVKACSAAGIDSIDGPFLDPEDTDGLLRETRIVAAMGFMGKASYDAAQIPHIHGVFTPTTDEIDFARRVLDAVAASDTGTARVDGQSVNKASLKSARHTLDIAERRGAL